MFNVSSSRSHDSNRLAIGGTFTLWFVVWHDVEIAANEECVEACQGFHEGDLSQQRVQVPGSKSPSPYATIPTFMPECVIPSVLSSRFRPSPLGQPSIAILTKRQTCWTPHARRRS
jgi:hypothetical protein